MYDKGSPRCMVTGCWSEEGDNVSYHEFPSNAVCRAKWMKALNINGDKKGMLSEQVTTGVCVCSKHFLPSDYRSAIGKRKILYCNAVPSQYLTSCSKSKISATEEKTLHHGEPKSKGFTISEEMYNSFIDETPDFEDIELLDVDLDFENLETINFNAPFDDDVPQHTISTTTQTDPIIEVESKSVSVQVDADLSRERRQIFLLRQKNIAMVEKIKKLTKELADERNKSLLQLKVIEKMKKGSTLFQINKKEKKEKM